MQRLTDELDPNWWLWRCLIIVKYGGCFPSSLNTVGVTWLSLESWGEMRERWCFCTMWKIICLLWLEELAWKICFHSLILNLAKNTGTLKKSLYVYKLIWGNSGFLFLFLFLYLFNFSCYKNLQVAGTLAWPCFASLVFPSHLC